MGDLARLGPLWLCLAVLASARLDSVAAEPHGSSYGTPRSRCGCTLRFKPCRAQVLLWLRLTILVSARLGRLQLRIVLLSSTRLIQSISHICNSIKCREDPTFLSSIISQFSHMDHFQLIIEFFDNRLVVIFSFPTNRYTMCMKYLPFIIIWQCHHNHHAPAAIILLLYK